MKETFKFITYFIGVLLFLSYLMWRTDVVPEVVGPVIGYIDDAIVAVVIWMMVKRTVKYYNLEKK
jgi:uncharacterized membrane protein YkvA (DUF1232 family)